MQSKRSKQLSLHEAEECVAVWFSWTQAALPLSISPKIDRPKPELCPHRELKLTIWAVEPVVAGRNSACETHHVIKYWWVIQINFIYSKDSDIVAGHPHIVEKKRSCFAAKYEQRLHMNVLWISWSDNTPTLKYITTPKSTESTNSTYVPSATRPQTTQKKQEVADIPKTFP